MMTEEQFQAQLEAIKADVIANLGDEKELLKQMAEPALKNMLTVLVKKGLLPLVKLHVEKSSTKIDDIVFNAIDEKVEAIVLDMIAQIKL